MRILTRPLTTKKRNEFIGLIRTRTNSRVQYDVALFTNPMNVQVIDRYKPALDELRQSGDYAISTMSGLEFGDARIILNPHTKEGELRIGYTTVARLFDHPVIGGEPVNAPNGQVWYLGAISDHHLDITQLNRLAQIGSYVFPVAIWQGYTNK